jgi:hypothetical protein
MEVTLLDIQIPVDQIRAAEKAIGEARVKLEALKEAQKGLDKGSEAYTKNAIKVKELNAEIRTNERVVIANTKAQKANEGSVEQLRSQLSLVSKQWADLSKDERENSEVGKKLSKSKLQLTEELKRLEKQTGDTRRNVGNYSEGVKEALKESGLFSREMAVINQVTNIYNTTLNTVTSTVNRFTKVNVDATQVNNSYAAASEAATAATVAQSAATSTATAASGGFSKALRVLKVALISTGIGAIVVALGSLAAAFFSTQEGSDKLSKALKPLQFIFDRLLGVLQDVGAALLKLDFKAVWNQIRGLGSAVSQAAKDGYAFAEATIAIEEAEIKLVKQQGKLNRLFEEQKQIVQDVTKTDDERREAAQKAIEALTESAELEAEIVIKQIQAKKLQLDQNNTDRVAKKELATLEAKLDEIVSNKLRSELRIKNQINTLDKQAADQRKRAAEDEQKAIEDLKKERQKAAEERKKNQQKAAEDAQKAIEEEIKREESLREQALKSELQYAERLAQEEINALRQRLLNREITIEQFNKRLEEKEIAALEARKVVLEAFEQDVTEIDDRILAVQVSNLEKQSEASRVAAETQKGQKEDVLKTAISTAGEQTAVGKILSSAQASINTYEAATLALASIPPPLGQIQAALITIQGLAQVAKINAIQVPKFATGIIGITGPGTGTSDSIPARISAGESVMTAKATARYAPLLASLERSVGNNPNMGKIGRGKFASGVINAGLNASRQVAQLDGLKSRDLAAALSQQQIFVSLTELDSEQVRFNQARAVSVVE